MTRYSIFPVRRHPRFATSSTPLSIMLDLIVALLPTLGMATYFYGPRVLMLTLISIGSCVGFEWLYLHRSGRTWSATDLSAYVTGLLLALCLPPTAPYWAPILGGFFAIVVVKQFYGGLGKNFMNPALAARMLLCTFPMMMTTWAAPMNWLSLSPTLDIPVDVVSMATPMSYLHNGLLPPLTNAQMLLGQHSGSIGEMSALMLLLGGAYLLVRQVITPRIPVTFLGTVAILTYLFPQSGTPLEWMTAQLLSGGLLLGAIFMATDYVTSPTTPRGQAIYGICCGILTVLLRYFGSYPDGVGWAILTMNCAVWLLDRAGMPRRFGVHHFNRTREFFLAVGADFSKIRFQVPKTPRLPLKKGEMPGEQHLDKLRAIWKSFSVFACLLIATGLLLAFAHSMTDFTIRQHDQVEQAELLAEVMPTADIISEVPYRTPDASLVSAGYRDNTLIGYCITLNVNGFGGLINMTVGIDVDGTVTGIAVTDHSETLEMGTQALTQDYFESFIGRSGTIRTHGANSVDVVSGATVTSRAIADGVNKALSIVADMQEKGMGDYEYGEV